jgi:hypothetical protein
LLSLLAYNRSASSVCNFAMIHTFVKDTFYFIVSYFEAEKRSPILTPP